MKKVSVKNKLSSKITLIVSSILFAFFLIGAGILYFFNAQKNVSFINSVLDEQISLVFNGLEDYRIQSKYRHLGKTLYGLDLVDAVTVYSKKCEPLLKIPMNNAHPETCKVGSKSPFFVKVLNDELSSVYSVVVTPKYSMMGVDSWIYYVFFFFFIAAFIGLLVLSGVIVNRSIEKPFEDLISSILGFVDSRNYQLIKMQRRQCPQEVRPMYDALIKATKQLDRAKEKLLNKQQLEADKRFGKILIHNLKTPIERLDSGLLNVKPGEQVTEEMCLNLQGLSSQVKSITEGLADRFLANNSQSGTSAISEYAAYFVEQAVSEYILSSRKLSDVKVQLSFSDESYALMAKVDKGELKTIVFNLLNNASEAIEGNGFILVTSKVVNNHLVFQVTDDGAGIKKLDLERIFKEGFTTKRKGNGIGLFHAKEMIESWGGYIGISSNFGKGTTVEFSFPVTNSSQFLSIGDILQIAEKSPLIALVEDDALVRQNWEIEAKKVGRPFRGFSTPEEFFESTLDSSLPLETLFFIDSNFEGSRFKGQDFSKDLFDRGYENLFISSNFDSSEFAHLYWVKGVLENKRPPWELDLEASLRNNAEIKELRV